MTFNIKHALFGALGAVVLMLIVLMLIVQLIVLFVFMESFGSDFDNHIFLRITLINIIITFIFSGFAFNEVKK